MKEAAQPSEDYVYSVHPSYKSQTTIRITRRLPPIHATSPSQHQTENPYVFKPKSYSRRSQAHERQMSPHVIPKPNKKFKFNQTEASNAANDNQLDKKYILSQLSSETPIFTTLAFEESSRMKDQTPFQLPLQWGTVNSSRSNPLLSHTIEIISSDNKKMMIPIHQGLLKANTNHSKQEQAQKGIVNPFNAKLKNRLSMEIGFLREYKSGYTPIDLQNKSKKDEEKQGDEDNKKVKAQSGPRTHFIKKKQSTLSLSRTCGVSYIKPSESVQGGPFEQLPPLIFQCSTSCNYSNQLRETYSSHIETLISLTETRWIPAILTNEEHMRDLLLGKPHGKVIWINGLQQVWPLLNEGVFILLIMDKMFAKTEKEVLNQFNTCLFKFGILAKKSTSGRKLFLKNIQPETNDRTQVTSLQSFEMFDGKVSKSSLQGDNEMKEEVDPLKVEEHEAQKSVSKPLEDKKMQDSPQEERKQCKDVCDELVKEFKDSRTVVTMSLKFEMYVDQAFWRNSPLEGKNILNAIIHTFEETLMRKSIEIIRDRFELLNKDKREEIMKEAVKGLRFGCDISKFGLIQDYQHSEEKNVTLESLKQLNEGLETRNPKIQDRLVAFTELYKDKDGKENKNLWQKSLKMPIYYISTRDSFAFDLVEKITILSREGRPYKKIEYFFEADNFPGNFGEYKKLFPNFQTGVVCYHDFFTDKELKHFETKTLQTEESAFKNKFLQMTVQPTIIGNRIKRTKFFFGYRYIWTRCQLAEPNSYVGAGVRRDVTEPPKWIKDVENPMVQHNILEANFLNSVAINVYHDGSEGLAQHFDDAVRFRQPIYTLRLVSDGRLSFGSQFYGFCNGAFIIPLPRGCICIMNESSYAANGVKHCVRPCDMSGKSAAIIMRQMHHEVVKEAAKYDELIDFPAWLSTTSEDPRAVTFAEQKRIEAEHILHDEEKRKEKQPVAMQSLSAASL